AKDANGCTATTTTTISQPLSAVSVSISSETDALCYGSNGSAIASASGGTGTITYKWNDANSSAGATLSAIAGTYTVTAKDANGCTATTSVTIGQPASTVSVTIASETNASCYGSTGSASANASGGTGTITYKWNDANSTAGTNLTALAGTYVVTAKDANGCTGTASVTIGQPGVFSTTITVLSGIACNGNATANASANPTGGSSPYTYKWSNGTTTIVSTSNPTGAILPAHGYTVTVTDNHGCTSTASVTITQPNAIRDSMINVTNANCANNGTATLGVKYGTLPYTYFWAPGGMTTATVNGLAAQTYTATITDNHGCIGTVRKAVINNVGSTLRDSISLSLSIGCNGGNAGQLSVGTRGGLTPYTYLWSNGNTTYSASNLTAGSYTVTVTDNNGCSNSLTATLTQPATALVATQASITYPQCSGGKGTASVTVTGGTPTYKYSWAPVACTVASCTNLSAGTYTVTTSDAHGCKSLVNIIMTQPFAIRDSSVMALKVNVNCNGQNNGSATVGIKYGTSPYTYNWSNGQTKATATGLTAGVYSVTVSDKNGCSGTTATVTITQPATALAESIGSITCTNNLVKATVTTTGGTSPYTYLWSPGGGTKATMSSLSQGVYTITVTDKHGCIDTLSKNLTCTPARLDGLDKGTSPECCGGLDNISLYPNPNTGQFILTGLEQGMTIEMYDYTGRKVSGITANDITIELNISDQPNGIYLIRILDSSGNLVSRKKVVKTN
ncbi:MAG TPA: T9SS type A sorting domain-containing protein, partial [Bacteroidia bacterium]|nr:T9SS type A sorting domain-containing protein [Bacteroidia bacterium]